MLDGGRPAVVCFPVSDPRGPAVRPGTPAATGGRSSPGARARASPVGRCRSARPSSSSPRWIETFRSAPSTGPGGWGAGGFDHPRPRPPARTGFPPPPPPVSQQACTIGGNVANNPGRAALPGLRRDQRPRARARGGAPRRVGDRARWLDGRAAGLRPAWGCFVGSEGTLGIATRIAVRSRPTRPRAHLLLDFAVVDAAAATVSGIIAAGIVPAALEMMDQRSRRRSRTSCAPGTHRRRGGAAGRARRARRPAWPRPGRAVGRSAAPARRPTRAGRRRRGRAGAAVEGPEVGVRRHRPDRARLLPARRGRAPHPPRRGAARGLRRSPTGTTSA